MLLSALLLAASVSADFRPDLFFAGRTRGQGTVSIATSSRPRILSVDGTGRLQTDGSLILSQAVTLDGKTTQREFTLRRVSPTAWQGTLTDAAGPVRATVSGNRMALAYPMKRGGMRMQQTLTLQPGGRTVLNRARHDDGHPGREDRGDDHQAGLGSGPITGNGRDGADFGAGQGARRERCFRIVTDARHSHAPKDARRRRRSSIVGNGSGH